MSPQAPNTLRTSGLTSTQLLLEATLKWRPPHRNLTVHLNLDIVGLVLSLLVKVALFAPEPTSKASVNPLLRFLLSPGAEGSLRDLLRFLLRHVRIA